MFTGIIEALGTVRKLRWEMSNLYITIESAISHELKIDQSIAHDGVCLTVVEVVDNTHTVTAIKETLSKTSLSQWEIDKIVNLERCMSMNGRLDGHLVQGHVDTTAICVNVKEEDGSWLFTFEYPIEFDSLIISKGSVCINGTSLTVVNPYPGRFSVAIIPYTFEHTNFKQIIQGKLVNIEFDIIGKYIVKNLDQYRDKITKPE